MTNLALLFPRLPWFTKLQNVGPSPLGLRTDAAYLLTLHAAAPVRISYHPDGRPVIDPEGVYHGYLITWR